MLMNFDLSKVELSKNDVRRGITLPILLSKELAEFIGIVIGDGHLSVSTGKQKSGAPLIKSSLINSGFQEYRLFERMRVFAGK